MVLSEDRWYAFDHANLPGTTQTENEDGPNQMLHTNRDRLMRSLSSYDVRLRLFVMTREWRKARCARDSRVSPTNKLFLPFWRRPQSGRAGGVRRATISGQGELAIPASTGKRSAGLSTKCSSRRRWLQFCLNPLWLYVNGRHESALLATDSGPRFQVANAGTIAAQFSSRLAPGCARKENEKPSHIPIAVCACWRGPRSLPGLRNVAFLFS
jgi:hypothetical protein